MDAFFTRRRLFSFVIVGILFVVGCTRISSTELGGGLIPAVDGVNTFDTVFNVTTDITSPAAAVAPATGTMR